MTAVATSERHAAAAGRQALRDGGNAVDAALAAAMCLPVVEPTGNGLGSDLFALVAHGDQVWALDSAGASSASLVVEEVVRVHGGAVGALGGAPVTVPGVVAGWVALHDRLGTLPWSRLLQPAVALAREGFAVGRATAAAWERSVERFAAFDTWRDTFLVQGRAPAAGERFANPDLASTLQRLQSEPDALYRGPLAEALAAAVRANGGWMTPDDLAAHTPRWVEPLRLGWGGWTVLGMPPPSQGVVALAALGILGDAAELGDVHRQVEAIKRAFGHGWAAVGDPRRAGAAAAQLLDPVWAAEQRAGLGDRASAGPTPPMDGHGTVLVCTSDAEGRVVCLIQSNFHGFGSGVVVPGTGVALQNRGHGFGPVADPVNGVAPGQQPFHTLMPGVVLRAGKPWLAYGCMGGQMQPQGHLQLLLALASGRTPQQAVDQPRWRWTPDGDQVLLEVGTAAAVAEALEARGHRVQRGVSARHFGGAQIAVVDGLLGSDGRKDGSTPA
ncbi:MAG: gamma-glutamyltransferase family protein [Myxococcales bacterium]|nr:gamma-glutamyltransferase family protein [Myxococcales bacterium]